MGPRLQFNLAEITWGWPPQGGVQGQEEPNLAKAPVVGVEQEENPAQGKWQEAQYAGNWDSKTQTQQKDHAAQSQIPEDLQLR